jgi:predicted RNA-binding protein with PIN domain
MSHFLIDGYNVLHREVVAVVDIETARERLTNRIRLFSASHVRDRFTLVFDGSPRFLHPVPAAKGNLRVVFSIDESADNLIKRMLDDERLSAGAVVVTDDREIRAYARAHKACVLDSSEFLARIAIGTKSAAFSKSPDSVMRPQDIRRINEEILQEWYRKYGV